MKMSYSKPGTIDGITQRYSNKLFNKPTTMNIPYVLKSENETLLILIDANSGLPQSPGKIRGSRNIKGQLARREHIASE